MSAAARRSGVAVSAGRWLTAYDRIWSSRWASSRPRRCSRAVGCWPARALAVPRTGRADEIKDGRDLLWAPRFYSTAALLWCVTLVGFASVTRAITFDRRWAQAQAAVLATAIAVIALCAFDQLGLVPTARNAYLLHSASPYSPAERQQADELFARYRREGKPDEPVVASTWLFRYAHDRNLFWLDRLHDRPAPIWMLGDTAEEYAPLRISSDTINPASGIHLADYTLIDRRGRFVLLRKKQ